MRSADIHVKNFTIPFETLNIFGKIFLPAQHTFKLCKGMRESILRMNGGNAHRLELFLCIAEYAAYSRIGIVNHFCFYIGNQYSVGTSLKHGMVPLF